MCPECSRGGTWTPEAPATRPQGALPFSDRKQGLEGGTRPRALVPGRTLRAHPTAQHSARHSPDRRPPRQQPSPWGPWLTERPSARAPAQVLCILGNHPHPTPPPTPDKQVAVMQEGCPTVGGVARWEPGETLCLCLS